MINGAELVRYNMTEYAGQVNQDRAIPDAKTGLKPIHLKILYEMYVDKIHSKGKYHKNAKMVGQVIARYSEHGDVSAYDALVRLGQDWVQLYPMIDFHGNAGSIFGDGPAAMRYTESKLAPLAEDGFLTGLKDKLPQKYWGENFTMDEPEPATLPAIFPGLFCLPNQGIGYGTACNFLTYNIADVYKNVEEYIEEKELSTIYFDFPTGGTIINPQVMESIAATGRGSVVVEGTYSVNGDTIEFTEIPWGVDFDKILDKLYEIQNANELPQLKEIINNSGKGKLRLVVKADSADNAKLVLDYILDKTPLRQSYGVNQVALVDNWPKRLTKNDMISQYVSHNLLCIQTEFENEAAALEHRIHIIEGLLIAVANIEKVIEIIKISAEVKRDLKVLYGLDNEQVDAILKMTLSRLSNIEVDKLEKEKSDKEKRLAYCKLVIENAEGEQEEILLTRLSDLVTVYAKPRRTQVEAREVVKFTKSKEKAAVIPIQLGIDFIPTGSYVKAMPISSYRKDSKAITSFKCMSDEMLLLFSSLGRVFRIKAGEIKNCTPKERGVAIGTLVKLQENETIVNVFTMAIDEKHPYLAAFTKNGMVKKTEKSIYTGATRNLSGLKACGLANGDKIIGIYETNGDYATITTKDGYSISFEMELVNTTGKTAKGVKAISLQSGDEVISAKITQVRPEKTQKRGGRGQKK